MGLWGWIGETFWGVNPETDAERSEELDAKLANFNAEAYATGRWNEEQYDLAETQRIAAKNSGEYNPDLWADFYAGAAEGLASTQAAVRGTVNATVGTLATGLGGFIPWWLWIVGAGFLAWKSGILGKGWR